MNKQPIGNIFSTIGLVLVCTFVVFVMVGLYAYSSFSEKVPLAIEEYDRSYNYQTAARGQYLFFASCANCHINAQGLVGPQEITVMPAYMGRSYVPNLTQDGLYGAPLWSDGELLRAIKHGVRKDGVRIPLPMPSYQNLSDDDAVALLAYLRIDNPTNRALQTPTIPSDLTVFGQVISVLYRAQDPVDTIAFDDRGEYLAKAVLHCATCHSPGSTGSAPSNNVYTGSSQQYSRSKQMIRAPALRGSTSAIQAYDRRSLGQLVRFGARSDGGYVEHPLAPYIHDDDIDELYEYFVAMFEPNTNIAEWVRSREPSSEECQACHDPIPHGMHRIYLPTSYRQRRNHCILGSAHQVLAMSLYQIMP